MLIREREDSNIFVTIVTPTSGVVTNSPQGIASARTFDCLTICKQIR